MAVLTEDRKTQMRDGELMSMQVAAGEKIFAGALVARDASGYAIAGATSTTVVGVGRAEGQVDNSAGADGDLSVAVRKGVFCFANDGTDTIDASHIGADCYIVDDQTVASNDGTGTRSVAGKVFDIDADGVWVKIQ